MVVILMSCTLPTTGEVYNGTFVSFGHWFTGLFYFKYSVRCLRCPWCLWHLWCLWRNILYAVFTSIVSNNLEKKEEPKRHNGPHFCAAWKIVMRQFPQTFSEDCHYIPNYCCLLSLCSLLFSWFSNLTVSHLSNTVYLVHDLYASGTISKILSAYGSISMISSLCPQYYLHDTISILSVYNTVSMIHLCLRIKRIYDIFILLLCLPCPVDSIPSTSTTLFLWYCLNMISSFHLQHYHYQWYYLWLCYYQSHLFMILSLP